MSHCNSKDLCIKWKIGTYLIDIINLTLNPNCMHPCVYERMQDRAHASASKRETVWKGAYWKKCEKCRGKGILSTIIETAIF